MNKNSIIIYTTILLILLLIAIPSVQKTIQIHQNRLLLVTEKKIIEAAKKCYYNDSCVTDEITLAELYEKTDLKELTNPVTNKVYSSSSYVDVQNHFAFVEKDES